MKVALFEKAHHLRITDKSVRPLDEGEYLIKVEACGVCGTDVHIVGGTSRSSPPVVLGHEYAGTVEDGAKGCARDMVGRKVAIDPNICCGICF
jgi:threonine dehydrogenase-like Zn-dependent dehydrogenase